MTAARRDAVALVAIVLAVAASVVFLPAALERWTLPKELLLVAAALLAAIAAPAGRLPRWLWIVIGAGAVILAVSALLGAAPLAQLFGRWPRYEGLVTIPVYVAAVWTGARLLGPGADGGRRSTFTTSVAIAAIASGVVSVAESFGLRPIPTDLSRPGALFGNASDQGLVGVMFAAVLAVAAARAWGRGGRPWLAAIGTLAAVLTVVASASRTAIWLLVALVVVLGVIAAVQRRWLALAVTTASGLAVVAVVALNPLASSRVAGTSPLASESLESRFVNWQATLELWRDNLLLGVGPSGYLDAIPAYNPEGWVQLVGRYTTIDSPHDWLLQAATAGGIPLLLLAIGTAAAILVTGARRLRGDGELLGAFLAVCALAVGLLTHFTTPATILFAGLLVGRLVAVPPGPAIPAVWSRVRIAGLAVWLVLFGLLVAADVPLRSGVDLASSGRPAEANAAFDAAQALRPWDADVAMIAAESFAAAADAGEPSSGALAIGWAERSLDRAPDSIAAALALAVGQQAQGDLTEARSTLEGARDRAPHDPRIAHRLGGILYLLGDAEGGRAELERAVSLDPGDVNTWLTLEFVCQQLGDEAGARQARAAIDELAS